MPSIASTSITGLGAVAVTETILDGADTLTFNRGAILTLRNDTAGALSPVIDGDGGTTVDVNGLGSVDVTGGYSVGSIAAADVITIRLDTISEYLKGTIDVNSGTGLVATLLEQ